MSADQLDDALADFRAWFVEWDGLPETEFSDPAADFSSVVGGFTALRQEVNLQTKATRTAVEQFAEALKLLHDRPAPAKVDSTADTARPFIKALIDVYDQLALAAHGVERQRIQQPPAAKPSVLTRLFGPKQPAADGAADALLAGYHMSMDRISRLLAQHGLEVIPALNRAFDPELMEAVDVETHSDRTPGTVVAELRRGYRWHGQVFRFAQVKVSR